MSARRRDLIETLEMLGYDRAHSENWRDELSDEGLSAAIGDFDPSDYPDISDMVAAIEKSKTVFDRLAAPSGLLPGDFVELHSRFVVARNACTSILAQISKAKEAAHHAR